MPGDDVVVRKLSPARRLVIGSVRAGRRAAPMHGLFTVDVTDARVGLATLDPPGSLTALVLAAVARAAAAHPDVHAWRDWRGRLVTCRQVDATVMVETSTRDGRVAVAHLLHDTSSRSVADLSAELQASKHDPSTMRESGLLQGALAQGTRLPGVVPAVYWWLGRTRRGRAHMGTVLVTAVGMFGGGSGFAMAPLGPYSLSVVVGGLSLRPWVHDGRVCERELLDLTVSVDHRVVDGAPAARFGAEVRRLLEDPALLGLVEAPSEASGGAV